MEAWRPYACGRFRHPDTRSSLYTIVQLKGATMRNEFRGNGNLADAPTLKSLNVDGEARSIAEMRVFFDRTRDDGHGGLADKGGCDRKTRRSEEHTSELQSLTNIVCRL